VLAHLARVVGEAQLPLSLVRGLERVEVGRERGLRVDHNVLAARDPHHEVGAQGAVLGRGGRLRDVVAVLDHPRELDDVSQLGLAPTAPNMRRAEGVRQASGALGQCAHLSLQGAVRLLAHPLDASKLHVHLLEGRRERTHVTGQTRVRELEEARARGVQRLGRERSHRSLQPLVEHVALGLERGPGSCQRPLEADDLVDATTALGQRRPHGQIGARRADGDAEDERDDDENDHRVDER
jgi:hypothetical protein